MLFNPMNEANSYVMLAPALAFWTVEFLQFSPRSNHCGVVLAAIIATMAFLPDILRPFLGNGFAMSWYPLMTVSSLAIELFCCRRCALEQRSSGQPSAAS
jgi:hypothetical protein